jgi:hypothetical protein
MNPQLLSASERAQMRIWSECLGSLGILATLLCMTMQTEARERHISVKKGKEVIVSFISLVNGDTCESMSGMNVDVINEPAHGAARYEIETRTIRKNNTSKGLDRCVGRKGKGLAIYYRAPSDYAGKDKFSIRMRGPGLRDRLDTYITIED